MFCRASFRHLQKSRLFTTHLPLQVSRVTMNTKSVLHRNLSLVPDIRPVKDAAPAERSVQYVHFIILFKTSVTHMIYED